MPGREGRGEEKWDLEGCRDEARQWEPVSRHREGGVEERRGGGARKEQDTLWGSRRLLLVSISGINAV